MRLVSSIVALREKLAGFRHFLLPLFISVVLISGFIVSLCSVRPVLAAGYPTLPTGVAYYESKYPVGLKYSQGWYGTFTKAPAGGIVYLYDDDNGICLFSMPVGAQSVPSGVQAGTTIIPESITNAQAIINSYPVSDYNAIPQAVADTMTVEDCFVGVWGGDKLAQKFAISASADPSLPETILTPTQTAQISADWANIVQQYDPPRYYVLAAGNNNWSSTGTWSANTNGSPTGASVPTNADAVAPSTSSAATGVLTVDNATQNCLSLDFTANGGVTNNPTFAGSQILQCYGSVTFATSANMTITYSGTLTIKNTSGTATVTSNSQTLTCPVTISGVGGTMQLGDTMNIGANTFTLSNGIFNTNTKNLTTTGICTISGSSTRTFSMSSSTVTCGTWTATTTTLLTFTTDGSSKLVVTGASGTFNGGSLTNYNEVDITGAAQTIAGSNTFVTLSFIDSSATQTVSLTNSTTQTVSGTFTATGYSTTARCVIHNTSSTTHATISAATVAVTKSTISYLTGSGAGSWDLSTGDNLQAVTSSCTGLKFRLYWFKNTGSFSSLSQWSSVDGVTANALAAPDATTSLWFTSASFDTSGQTVTNDIVSVQFLDMNWTGSGNSGTTTPSYVMSAATGHILGNVIFAPNMSINTSTHVLSFYGAASQLTTNGSTITSTTTSVEAFGVLTLQDSLTCTGSLYAYGGTLNTNNQTVHCAAFGDGGQASGIITLGSSVINCTSFSISGAGSSVTANTATINCSGTFSGGGIITYNIVNLTGATSTVSGNNTFAQFNLTSGTTQAISFTDGTTQTAGSFSLGSTAGFVHTLQGTSTGGWNIAKTGGGTVFGNYLVISYSAASPANTFYYGSNSTYNGTSGWQLCALPTISLSVANSITTTTATLNGQITSLNGSAVNSTVTMYYGTSDGLQVPASWTNNVAPTSPAQPQGVASFYYNASSLTAGTTYYFSASASNLAGTVWVTASYNFPTICNAPTGVSASTNQTGYVTISWSSTTGATNYDVFYSPSNVDVSGVLGNVLSYNDTNAPAGTITAGTCTASQGTSLTLVTISNSGQSTNNGASTTYYVKAINSSGSSAASSTSTGNRIVGSISLQGQVSAADTDASYSDIPSATTSPYNYANAPVDGSKRFYRYRLDATGANEVTSTAMEGWIFYLGAPTNFTQTASGNNITLSWTPNGNATDTVIIVGSNGYPTSITDGTTLYNGAGTSYTYTNGNSELSTQYFSAFSYYSGFGGIYSANYATVMGGAAMMLLIFLGGLTLILSYFEIRTRNMPLGALAAGSWIVLWKYVTSNNLITDNSSQNIFTIVCIIGGLVFFFWGILSTRMRSEGGDNDEKYNRFGIKIKEPPPENETRKRSGTGRGIGTESADDYKARIHKALHPHEKD